MQTTLSLIQIGKLLYKMNRQGLNEQLHQILATSPIRVNDDVR